MSSFKIISPIDQSVFATIPYHDDSEVRSALSYAKKSQKTWRQKTLVERIACLKPFCDALFNDQTEIAKTITWQMGRPISHSLLELNGVKERTEALFEIALKALAPVTIESSKTSHREITHQPCGLVLNIAPWNYPLLTAVNTIIPGLLAGNAVILKHAEQTALCSEIFDKALEACNLPAGLFQYLHITHDQTEQILQSGEIHSLCFTGSVKTGLHLQSVIKNQTMMSNFELGGHDAAYVSAQADIEYTSHQLVDGAFFNAGQSCCGIKRIYVHHKIYKTFLEAFIQGSKQLKLGDPSIEKTTLGPVVNLAAAEFLKAQVQHAVKQGAELVQASDPVISLPDNYLPPQILLQADHDMEIMHQESFGPLVKIQSVQSDAEAVALMNDSQFGLTASVWSQDIEAVKPLCRQLEAGTIFVNRCDYLDPYLPWAGLKQTGTGISLSSLGFRNLTRTKSFHFRGCA